MRPILKKYIIYLEEIMKNCLILIYDKYQTKIIFSEAVKQNNLALIYVEKQKKIYVCK